MNLNTEIGKNSDLGLWSDIIHPERLAQFQNELKEKLRLLEVQMESLQRRGKAVEKGLEDPSSLTKEEQSLCFVFNN
jgi:hypothetical protein